MATWKTSLIAGFVALLFSGSVFAQSGKLSDRLSARGDFNCQPFEGGNLCTTRSAPGFNGPVSFYVPSTVTQPDQIAIQFHGLRTAGWKYDTNAATMIKGFN